MAPLLECFREEGQYPHHSDGAKTRAHVASAGSTPSLRCVGQHERVHDADGVQGIVQRRGDMLRLERRVEPGNVQSEWDVARGRAPEG